ncbi:hypothetical protein E4P41_15090 [Geodermatophilus sp. DF01-2]|uniref:hypothetical protein n=1 Tax=Geodermatophilus sp. DF01-2 TaxID=2559610 RepID=UPI001073B401|nr:hypothetical protein [Geodermatophilus sp. DF01_2]TFV57025.1 hypothetical protein E4P41_15090 [Geodermatophilus sp. DF01_2]
MPEDHAHGNLRSALWRLHKVAPGLVEVTGDVLALADGVRVDVREPGDWARRMQAPRCDLGWLQVLDDLGVPAPRGPSRGPP